MSRSRRTRDAPRERGTQVDDPVTPEITFHRSEDLILGVCGARGSDGIYRFFIGSGGGWELCPNGTRAWDWYHQLLFLKGDATPCDPWALGESVPPIPESFPPPEQYIVRDPPEPEAPHAMRGSPVFERVAAALSVRGDVLVIDEGDAEISPFDHFMLQQVTDSLAASLGG